MKIDEMFAFVGQEPDGSEGVMCFPTSQGLMPMVGGDPTRIQDLIPLAQAICRQYRRSFRILKFSVRSDVTAEMMKQYAQQTAVPTFERETL